MRMKILYFIDFEIYFYPHFNVCEIRMYFTTAVVLQITSSIFPLVAHKNGVTFND